jgi:hypothetical protein
MNDEFDDKTTTAITSVSERKLHANRENAKRSTGPTSEAGKRTSRFNSLKHGLLAKRLISRDGQPEEGLQHLLEGLREEYGQGDVRLELLQEVLLVDYWRHRKGLDYELALFDNSDSPFHPQGTMPNVQRYIAGNRRALLKSLELMEKLRTLEQGDESAGEPAGCSPSAELQSVDECGRESSQTEGSHEKSVTKLNEHQQ